MFSANPREVNIMIAAPSVSGRYFLPLGILSSF
jgi:hypothetical protein